MSVRALTVLLLRTTLLLSTRSYDTINEFNVDSKVECDQLNLAHETKTNKCKFRLYRAMLRRARYCYEKSSVCRLSVRDIDHIGWNSSKIILQLVSLGCSLSAGPEITDLLQREHPQNFDPSDPVELSVADVAFHGKLWPNDKR